MKFWQWIMRWITIREHPDLKAIEKAISLMGKVLPILQGLVLGTWTLAISYKWSLAVYLWIEIIVTVFVSVGIGALRSKVAAKRDESNDASEVGVLEEMGRISAERKRRLSTEARNRQAYDLKKRRAYGRDRMYVGEPYQPEQWNDATTINEWNKRIRILQDQQRRTRREANSIEEQGRGLVKITIALYVLLSIIFTVSWSFKWAPVSTDQSGSCCPVVSVECPPTIIFQDTCRAKLDGRDRVALDSTILSIQAKLDSLILETKRKRKKS